MIGLAGESGPSLGARKIGELDGGKGETHPLLLVSTSQTCRPEHVRHQWALEHRLLGSGPRTPWWAWWSPVQLALGPQHGRWSWAGPTHRLQGAWSQATIRLAGLGLCLQRTDEGGVCFLGTVWDLSLLGKRWGALSVFCRSEWPGVTVAPFCQTVEHFSKDFFSAPPTFVFRISPCSTASSQTSLSFGNNPCNC